MNPRMSPSSRTWGRMPRRSGRSMREGGGMRSGPAGPARSDSGPALVLRGAGGRDRELLHDLVVAPLLRIVAVDLEHEVQRLLPIALGVELDVAGDAGQLHLAKIGRAHV